MTELMTVLLCLGTSYICVAASFFLIVRTVYLGPANTMKYKSNLLMLALLALIWPITLLKIGDR